MELNVIKESAGAGAVAGIRVNVEVNVFKEGKGVGAGRRVHVE